MASIDKQLKELQKIQNLQQRSHWMNDLHPLGKLLLSVLYILITVSFNKYDLNTLLIMSVYPIFGFIAGELSFKEGLYRMRLILPLVIFVGVFNPFFDKIPITTIGMFTITSGMISMLTLMLKGFYSVLSAYILIATTSIDDICYALRCIRIPRVIVIVIMLIYRYFGIMGQEADRIVTAYKLRAPSQKGIHYKAWGTLVGQWLLRSMDRAEDVYESMLLRGFSGDFKVKKRILRKADVIYALVWILIMVLIRVHLLQIFMPL